MYTQLKDNVDKKELLRSAIKHKFVSGLDAKYRELKFQNEGHSINANNFKPENEIVLQSQTLVWVWLRETKNEAWLVKMRAWQDSLNTRVQNTT